MKKQGHATCNSAISAADCRAYFNLCLPRSTIALCALASVHEPDDLKEDGKQLAKANTGPAQRWFRERCAAPPDPWHRLPRFLAWLKPGKQRLNPRGAETSMVSPLLTPIDQAPRRSTSAAPEGRAQSDPLSSGSWRRGTAARVTGSSGRWTVVGTLGEISFGGRRVHHSLLTYDDCEFCESAGQALTGVFAASTAIRRQYWIGTSVPLCVGQGAYNRLASGCSTRAEADSVTIAPAQQSNTTGGQTCRNFSGKPRKNRSAVPT